MSVPTISKTWTTPRREAGVAGQFSISTTVTYDGEAPSRLAFVSSAFGGPIIMVMGSGVQVPVTEPWRFGEKLDAAWVEAFLRAS